MRSVLYLVTALTVMAMAFWAYRENYSTQAALSEKTAIQREMAALRDDMVVLRAEWAYLNRPERLRQLSNLNFDELKLVPFSAEQFVDVVNVTFAPPKPVVTPGTELAAGPAIERPSYYPPMRPREFTP